MGKRRKVRKHKGKYVDGNGQVYEGDFLEVNLKEGNLEDLLNDALQAEEDDNIIGIEAAKIREYLKSAEREKDTLKKWYELGKMLQFVDRLNLNSETAKREAFTRLFKDLHVDAGRNPSLEKLERYPQHMYDLSKLPKDLVFYKGMSWSRWFDILEYKGIVNDKKILFEIVQKCCDNNWSASNLRKTLQSLNKKIKGRISE